MKFSESWLREWVNPSVNTEVLIDQLSMAGLEVDSVSPVADDFEGVVIGKVISRVQHPNADKLSLCKVDVGDGNNRQIICGAPNVAAGLKVPVALVGARLPGDFKIKKANLRGVESHGMICSAAELGLADSSDGIMPLPGDAPVGEDFREYLDLEDMVIDLDLTPDRGDCLGLAGVAREVGVINSCLVTQPALQPVPSVIQDVFQVELEAPVACPRYTCRIIRAIDPDAATPLWMQERLRRSGLRSISPVVDVTNYILLELGQPMHGFDLRQLEAGIRVRMASSGEKLLMLDGSELSLREDTLVIADHGKVVAIAGIMGGLYSGVAADTRDILLESAFFAPTAIIGKARSYGMHTDASHRFERGVDPNLQRQAIERATELLLEIVGGEPGPVVESVSDTHLPIRPEILLRRERVRRLLGVSIDDSKIEDILTRLDMRIKMVPEGWLVTAPSCRFDIDIEADLIEEIGRIYGYTEIPTHRGAVATVVQSQSEVAFSLERARQVLVARGFYEAVTYSFISRELHDLMDPEQGTVEIANPISADMSIMRTSLWPGLLQAVQYNQARRQSRLRLFESGLRFIKQDNEIKQELMLSGLICGTPDPEQWGAQSRAVDFYDLKADLEAVLALTGAGDEFVFTLAEHPALHPGQTAKITRDGHSIGWIGMLHPQIAHKLDVAGNLFLFDLRIDRLLAGRLPDFQVLSKYPSIRRDIAIVVDEQLPFSVISDCIWRAAPKNLKDILLFDVYTGGRIDSGLKSIAFGLILQETSHTLTDTEVEGIVERILKLLNNELKAQLRD